MKGKVEEVELPVDKVDIIISEWMGYFLLYESMLDTVLFARDKWLTEGGLMLPDKAVLNICAIEDADYKAEKIDCKFSMNIEETRFGLVFFIFFIMYRVLIVWGSVYGFDMSVIKNIAITEPLVDVVEGKAVVSNTVPILSLDLLTCTKEDCDFESDFRLTVNRDDFCHAFVAYFDCAFTQVHKPIAFSTSPFATYTHWKQTVFYLQEALTVCNGEEIVGHIKCARNPKNPRDLDIAIDTSFQGKCMPAHSATQNYRLR